MTKAILFDLDSCLASADEVGGCSHRRLRPSAQPTIAASRKKRCARRSSSAGASRSMSSPTNTVAIRAAGWHVFRQRDVTEPMYQSRSDCVRVVFCALYVFSVSRFHVPQERSKIAQRFIAGLWREHKTSPVRDERTHRASPIFSVAPTGLWPFSNRNPRLKPWATFGRPYRDFGILALPSFNMSATRSTSGCNVAAETSNHLRVGEPAATRRVALRSRIPTGFRPKAQGCEARATLGHRPRNIPNRNAVEAHPFPPARLTSATTPLALIRFPNAHPR